MSETPSPDNHSITIDLDPEWVTSLQNKLQLLPFRKPGINPPTISRVPSYIREYDPKAYEPKMIALGPYHSDNARLKHMNNFKLRCLQKFLRQNSEVVLEDYLRLIKRLEPEARSCYASERLIVDIGSDEFSEMLLLDGCFLLKLLFMPLGTTCKYNEREDEEGDDEDPIQHREWMLLMIDYDMLKLENQIPFFILEDLFDLVMNGDKSHSLVDLLRLFFEEHILRARIVVPSVEIVPKFHHILHFFHSCIMPAASTQDLELQSEIKPYKPTIYRKLGKMMGLPHLLYRRVLSSVRWNTKMKIKDETKKTDSPYPTSVPVRCARKLNEAGVKFRNTEARSFLDVTFEKGIMSIPLLEVYAPTNCLFRNLIAFEQCFFKAGMQYVTAYAVLMDCLIDTNEDVALLHNYGCIENGLGNDDEPAALFNRLCKEIPISYDDCYLAPLYKNVKKHCDRKWNGWRAKLMRDYFSNPWSFLSLVGALVIIFLTVIQTAFTVVSYFRPPK